MIAGVVGLREVPTDAEMGLGGKARGRALGYSGNMEFCRGFPLADGIVLGFADALGGDLPAYRNHLHRVLNYYLVLAGGEHEGSSTVLIAAAFHDLGIWVDGTFDYLGPSRRLAREHLTTNGLEGMAPEVEAIIEHHHKLTPYRGPFAATVETFRRADLVDVSGGAIRSGVPRAFVRVVKAAFPNAGFHRRLIALTMREALRNPLRPLPMVHW